MESKLLRHKTQDSCHNNARHKPRPVTKNGRSSLRGFTLFNGTHDFNLFQPSDPRLDIEGPCTAVCGHTAHYEAEKDSILFIQQNWGQDNATLLHLYSHADIGRTGFQDHCFNYLGL